MPDWVIWMVSAGVLAVGEIFTLSLFLGPVAIAAALAGLAALAGAGVAVALIVFTLAAAGSLLVLRPIARRHLHTPNRLRTGAAALVGSSATVLERVDGAGGQIRLAGEVWSARAFDDDEVLEPGARVEVLEIRGATALVSE